MSTIIKQVPGPLFEVADKIGLRVRAQALVVRKDGVVKLTPGQVVATGATPTPGNYDVAMDDKGVLTLQASAAGVPPEDVIGGATFAPGGCAPRYDGGDKVPQWNPFSIWDRTWRPTCPDPRGMALINGRFWADIFLAGRTETRSQKQHILDCITAFDATLLAERAGKSLPTMDEYNELAFGVRERSSLEKYQEYLEVDAPRTSRFGIMQATSCRYIWLRLQSDPTDELSVERLRVGLAGGYWVVGAYCGSRSCDWSDAPSDSGDDIGARFRCDHLSLV